LPAFFALLAPLVFFEVVHRAEAVGAVLLVTVAELARNALDEQLAIALLAGGVHLDDRQQVALIGDTHRVERLAGPLRLQHLAFGFGHAGRTDARRVIHLEVDDADGLGLVEELRRFDLKLARQAERGKGNAAFTFKVNKLRGEYPLYRL